MPYAGPLDAHLLADRAQPFLELLHAHLRGRALRRLRRGRLHARASSRPDAPIRVEEPVLCCTEEAGGWWSMRPLRENPLWDSRWAWGMQIWGMRPGVTIALSA